jgi:hypothetical protein
MIWLQLMNYGGNRVEAVTGKRGGTRRSGCLSFGGDAEQVRAALADDADVGVAGREHRAVDGSNTAAVRERGGEEA